MREMGETDNEIIHPQLQQQYYWTRETVGG
jgi:hypothetical protein